jgi:hypothetical protein
MCSLICGAYGENKKEKKSRRQYQEEEGDPQGKEDAITEGKWEVKRIKVHYMHI